MKRCLFFVFGMMIASVLMAGPVDQETARQEALNFINRKASSTFRRAQAVGPELTLATSEPAYHVFNVGQGEGFVVVSGSDCAPGVLGYSNEGTFDASNLPDNMKAWLQGYADQMAWLESHGGEPVATQANLRRAGEVTKASIAPMIQTQWDQAEPYNYLCPDFFDGGKSVTGCVATALAQLLYYHHQKEGYPLGTTKDIPAYECPTEWEGYGRVSVDACPQTTFDWDNMQKTYTGEEPSTDVTAQAVAKLMQYCGAVLEMNYSSTASNSSFSSSRVLRFNDYFGYDQRVKRLSHDFYYQDEWEDIVYKELAAGRPVFYEGESTGGGHAFLCDGYDSDGYFHINWGWSGHGNSYFRLSVLNPYLTGEIGASSSSDGYSMGQGIVIGIEKPVGDYEPEKGRLIWIDLFPSDEHTCTVERSTSTSVSLFVAYRSDLTYAYDIECAVGLFDEDNNLVSVSSTWTTENLKPSYRQYGQKTVTFDFSESVLPSGKTYTLKGLSRIKGTTEWIESVGAFTYVEVKGLESEVVLTSIDSTPTLQATDIQLITDGTVGTMQVLTATVKNMGTVPYFGLANLNIGDDESIASYTVNLKPGESTVATFTFKPTKVGTNTVYVHYKYSGDYPIIGSKDITFVAPENGDDTPELTFATRLNTEGSYILGNKLTGVVTATNNTDNLYVGEVILWRYQWIDNQGKGNGYRKTVTVPAHSSVDVTYEYDVEMDGKYSVVLTYKHNGVNEDVNKSATIYTFYYPKPAVAYVTADGTKVLRLAEPSITVPDDALAVDLRGQNIVQNVTPNSNPNTLYLLDEAAAAPTGIATNVVKGETAQSLTLTDGYDFYAPFDFMAQSATYERVFTQGLTADWKGWSTIVLPFNVESVKADSEPIDWFHSDSDTNGRFWVYAFTADGPDEVTFSHASQMKAYTPYIISVPGNEWGEKYNLVGKTLTFEGSNVGILSGAKTSVSGYNYIFRGDLNRQTLTNVYALDAEGENFTKAASATTVDPFRACFVASSHGMYGSTLAISFKADNDPTAILAPTAEGASRAAVDAVYNLNGQQVGTRAQWKSLPRGIYIVNGKKISK